MFVIRSAQTQTLSNSVRASFHRRILAFLRETLPERTEKVADAPLLERIAVADQRAMGLGLKTERGITRFVALTFMIGPKFDETPEMRAYFDRATPDADEKVHWLVKVLAASKKSTQEKSLVQGIVEGGRTVVGLIIGTLLSPFMLCATGIMGAGGLMGGVEMAGGAEAAGGLAALGPIGWAVLGVAAAVVVGAIVYNEINKVDENSDSIPNTKAPTMTQECPNKANSGENEGSSSTEPKTEDDIDEGRQNIHKPGTNENKTRTASPKGKPTEWEKPEEADKLTVEAANKGTVTQTHPDGSPAEIKWDAQRPVGKNGESQVTVKLKPNGKIHGFPSGPKSLP